MQHARHLLASIQQTAKSEQSYIQNLANIPMSPSLRSALKCQLDEYAFLECQAHSIGAARGWDMTDTLSAQYLLRNISTQIQLRHGNPDSIIAGNTILRNTKTMIRTIKYRNMCRQADGQIDALSQKLLDCETANIRQMQSYL